MSKKQLDKEIFLNKDYDKALELIEENHWACENEKGFIYLQKGDYQQAYIEYDKASLEYHKGFCSLLLGDYELAKKIWYNSTNSPAISWGKVLLGILNRRIEGIPSFLQVRNYMETTLHYFFEANQIDYAERVISAKEFWADCNIEAYKYIGRILMSQKNYPCYDEMSQEYLEMAVRVLPQDYEAYYLLGRLNISLNKKELAKHYLKKALNINPYHVPSKNLLEE